MFKRIETAWNAHTPDYLHPRTKENFIWQLKLTAVLIVGMIAYDEIKERIEARKRNARHLKVVPDPK